MEVLGGPCHFISVHTVVVQNGPRSALCTAVVWAWLLQHGPVAQRTAYELPWWALACLLATCGPYPFAPEGVKRRCAAL